MKDFKPYQIITGLIKSTSNNDLKWRMLNSEPNIKISGGPVYYMTQYNITKNKCLVFYLKSDMNGTPSDSNLRISYKTLEPYTLHKIEKLSLNDYPTLIALLRMVQMKTTKF